MPKQIVIKFKWESETLGRKCTAIGRSHKILVGHVWKTGGVWWAQVIPKGATAYAIPSHRFDSKDEAEKYVEDYYAKTQAQANIP